MKLILNGKCIYTFKDRSLYDCWRRHPSLYRDNKIFQHYEFFGDRIVAYEMSKLIVHRNISLKNRNIFLANACSTEMMAEVIRPFMRYIEYDNPVFSDKMAADSLEALIACVYLDGGSIELIIRDLWGNRLKTLFPDNHKSQLQEHPRIKPQKVSYLFVKQNIGFTCIASICINNKIIQAQSEGKTKKIASMAAAKNILDKIN